MRPHTFSKEHFSYDFVGVNPGLSKLQIPIPVPQAIIISLLKQFRAVSFVSVDSVEPEIPREVFNLAPFLNGISLFRTQIGNKREDVSPKVIVSQSYIAASADELSVQSHQVLAILSKEANRFKVLSQEGIEGYVPSHIVVEAT